MPKVAKTRCFILVPIFTRRYTSDRLVDGIIEEAAGLARAIDLDVVGSAAVNITGIKPATLIGRGKIDEIKSQTGELEVDLVIVDSKLTPVQQRNLEKLMQCKVIDRTALILEIFGDRAITREGKLQVELAALNYQKSRLVRTWTHLERQRGGFGFTGGPGETQLELDKRIISDRILVIEKELEKVVRTRTLHRNKRKKNNTPAVALVGYTNAGKSTLFNLLTGSKVIAENKLFATLDPTIRSLKLPSGTEAILSDTVGFVSNLPTELVASFRATLEEVMEADLIIHVRDISHPETEEQKKDVIAVLTSLGLEEKIKTSMIEVLNKVDCLPKEQRKEYLEDTEKTSGAIPVSALKNLGIEKLLYTIEKKIVSPLNKVQLKVDCGDGKTISYIERNGRVIRKKLDEDRIIFTVLLSDADLGFLGRNQHIEIKA